MEDRIEIAIEATCKRLGSVDGDDIASAIIRDLADRDECYENLIFEAGIQAMMQRRWPREDKQAILYHLKQALNLTRAGDDITALNYDKEREEVQVHFNNSSFAARRINVSCDSGIAMIRDVMRGLEIG
jgi:hypothetical protein